MPKWITIQETEWRLFRKFSVVWGQKILSELKHYMDSSIASTSSWYHYHVHEFSSSSMSNRQEIATPQVLKYVVMNTMQQEPMWRVYRSPHKKNSIYVRSLFEWEYLSEWIQVIRASHLLFNGKHKKFFDNVWKNVSKEASRRNKAILPTMPCMNGGDKTSLPWNER